MVSCSFHSPPGVLFTFPSRYLFTIGCLVIFSLTRWSSQIQKGFHVSLSTWGVLKKYYYFRLQDFHLLWHGIPPASPNTLHFIFAAPQPSKNIEFRLIPFRSPLLRESLLLSFPLVTKMFQFTRFALSSLCVQEVVLEVSLFGYFRIKTCFQFPETYRR